MSSSFISFMCSFYGLISLGMAPAERKEGKRLPSKLPLSWSEEDLQKFILQQFPRLLNYQLAKAGKNKGLEMLGNNCNTPAKLKAVLGRSALYIVPNDLKVWNEISHTLRKSSMCTKVLKIS